MCVNMHGHHPSATAEDQLTLTNGYAIQEQAIQEQAIQEQAEQEPEQSGYEKRLCPHCDLLVDVPELKVGQRAACPRCRSIVKRREANQAAMPMIYATSALFMLALALSFPFVNIRITGIFSQTTLGNITNAMVADNYVFIALIFLSFVLLVPVFCLVSVLLIGFNVKLPQAVRRTLGRYLFMLQPWCMAEIFLVAVLVSFVKLLAYGDIGVGLSFVPYCLFCLLQLKTFQSFDRRWVWQKIAKKPAIPFAAKAGQTGLSQGLRLCTCCHAILAVDQLKCPRCYTFGHPRRPYSLQFTLALLITSLVIYIPANVLPIMITGALGDEFSSTIISGVIILWEDKSYPVAIIIFFASIIIPSLKILAIGWLCYYARKIKKGTIDREHMHLVYEIVEIVGRWSMIDIFVIAILSSLVRMGKLMSVYPDIGSLFFATVVIITMISAAMFDPRLLWDRAAVLTNKESDRAGE